MILMGDAKVKDKAFLAAWSSRSFPLMLQWLGIQLILILMLLF